MKGLAWYSAIIYALFILTCLGLAVTRWLPPVKQPQGFVTSIAPLVYAILSVLALSTVIAFIRSRKYEGRGKAVFCLVWTIVAALLPVILAVAGSSYTTAVAFTLLSAGYEWSFIGIAVLFMLLFIAVIVFWVIYLVRLGKAAGTVTVA